MSHLHDTMIVAQAHELAELKATRELFPMTEAQFLALDRALDASKADGSYAAARDRFALQQQLNAGGFA